MSIIDNPEYKAYKRYLKMGILRDMLSKYSMWMQNDYKNHFIYRDVGSIVDAQYEKPYFPETPIMPTLMITHEPIVWLCLFPDTTDNMDIGISYRIYLNTITNDKKVVP